MAAGWWVSGRDESATERRFPSNAGPIRIAQMQVFGGSRDVDSALYQAASANCVVAGSPYLATEVGDDLHQSELLLQSKYNSMRFHSSRRGALVAIVGRRFSAFCKGGEDKTLRKLRLLERCLVYVCCL